MFSLKLDFPFVSFSPRWNDPRNKSTDVATIQDAQARACFGNARVLSPGYQYWTPRVSAPSMTRLVPVVKLDAGLARNTTPRAISSGRAIRPVGLSPRACLKKSGLLFLMECQTPPSK